MLSDTSKQTRGERNFNPGNIDRTATKWQGQSADQSGDARFVVFDSPEWGIRALARTILTYRDTHGLKTIRQIINRWAPPVENDTGAYVNAVGNQVGIDPDVEIDLDSPVLFVRLVKAIIRHENGRCVYPDSVVEEGVRRAL